MIYMSHNEVPKCINKHFSKIRTVNIYQPKLIKLIKISRNNAKYTGIRKSRYYWWSHRI